MVAIFFYSFIYLFYLFLFIYFYFYEKFILERKGIIHLSSHLHAPTHSFVHTSPVLFPLGTHYLVILLENARHCGASLIEYTRRTWSSYMHLTVIRMWLNLRHKKSNEVAIGPAGSRATVWVS